MEQAVAGYATRLAEKLRRHGLARDHVTVFMHTSPFSADEPQRNVSMTIDIPEATNDTMQLIKASKRAVEGIWKSGFRYSKAGIIIQDLVPPGLAQRSLFDSMDHEKAAKVMAAMDAAIRRWGRATVMPAAVGLASKSSFSTKFEMRSPRYTTRWDELSPGEVTSLQFYPPRPLQFHGDGATVKEMGNSACADCLSAFLWWCASRSAQHKLLGSIPLSSAVGISPNTG